MSANDPNRTQYRRSDDPRGVSVAGAELLRAHLDLIVAQGSEVALQAVIEASRTIPIVLQAINYDPLGRGYVASLARPGGSITGVFYQQAELAAKKVELLTQAVPGRTSLGVLWDALVTDQFEATRRKGAWVGASCRQARTPALQFMTQSGHGPSSG